MSTSLSWSEVAELVGVSESRMRAIVADLMRNGFDMRAKPAERTYSFDRSKVEAWISAGRPTPHSQTKYPHVVRGVDVTRTSDGSWILTDPHEGNSVKAESLRQAILLAKEQIAAQESIRPGEVGVMVTSKEWGEELAQLATLSDTAENAREQFKNYRQELIQRMYAAGLAQLDIAQLIGISQPTVANTLRQV